MEKQKNYIPCSNFAGRVFGRTTISSFDAQKKGKLKSQLLGWVAFGSKDHVYIEGEVKRRIDDPVMREPIRRSDHKPIKILTCER